MQKKNYLHKTLALVMAFLMIVTMMPVNIFAADPSTVSVESEADETMLSYDKTSKVLNWDDQLNTQSFYWPLRQGQKLRRIGPSDPLHISSLNYDGYYINQDGQTVIRLTYNFYARGATAVWTNLVFRFDKTLYEAIDWDKSGISTIKSGLAIVRKAPLKRFSDNGTYEKMIALTDVNEATYMNRILVRPIELVISDNEKGKAFLDNQTPQTHFVQLRTTNSDQSLVRAYAPSGSSIDYSTYTYTTPVILYKRDHQLFLPDAIINDSYGRSGVTNKAFTVEYDPSYDTKNDIGKIKLQYVFNHAPLSTEMLIDDRGKRPLAFVIGFDKKLLNSALNDPSKGSATVIGKTLALNGNKKEVRNSTQVDIKRSNIFVQGDIAYIVIANNLFDSYKKYTGTNIDGGNASTVVVGSDLLNTLYSNNALDNATVELYLDNKKTSYDIDNESKQNEINNYKNYVVTAGFVVPNKEGWATFTYQFKDEKILKSNYDDVKNNDKLTFYMSRPVPGNYNSVVTTLEKDNERSQTILKDQIGYMHSIVSAMLNVEELGHAAMTNREDKGCIQSMTFLGGRKISVGDKLRVWVQNPDYEGVPLMLEDIKWNLPAMTFGDGGFDLKKSGNFLVEGRLSQVINPANYATFTYVPAESQNDQTETVQIAAEGNTYKINDESVLSFRNRRLSSGGLITIDMKRVKPGTVATLKAKLRNGADKSVEIQTVGEAFKREAKDYRPFQFQNTGIISMLSLRKAHYLPKQDIFTNDYTDINISTNTLGTVAGGKEDETVVSSFDFKTNKEKKDKLEKFNPYKDNLSKFMTDTKQLRGYTLYEGGAVVNAVFPKNVIDETHIKPTAKGVQIVNHALNDQIDKNGAITLNMSSKVSAKNKAGETKEYDAYMYAMDAPKNIKLKKDMQVFFTNSESSSLYSKWKEERVRTRVLFDKNTDFLSTENGFKVQDTSTDNIVKIVPDNERYAQDPTYVPNGFNLKPEVADKVLVDEFGKKLEGEELELRQWPEDPDPIEINGKTYKFLGWATKSTTPEEFAKAPKLEKANQWNDTTTVYRVTKGSPIDSHQVVYGVWGEGLKIYLHSNNGTNEAVNEILVVKKDFDNTGANIEIPRAPYWSGDEDVTDEMKPFINTEEFYLPNKTKDRRHTFIGWSTDKEDTDLLVGFNYSELAKDNSELPNDRKNKLSKAEYDAKAFKLETLAKYKDPSATKITQLMLPNGYKLRLDGTYEQWMKKNYIHLYAQYRPFYGVSVTKNYRYIKNEGADDSTYELKYTDSKGKLHKITEKDIREVNVGLLYRTAVTDFSDPTVHEAANYHTIAKNAYEFDHNGDNYEGYNLKNVCKKEYDSSGNLITDPYTRLPKVENTAKFVVPGFDDLGQRLSYSAVETNIDDYDKYYDFKNKDWSTLGITIYTRFPQEGKPPINEGPIVPGFNGARHEAKIQYLEIKDNDPTSIDTFTSATIRTPLDPLDKNGNKITTAGKLDLGGYAISMYNVPREIPKPEFDTVYAGANEAYIDFKNLDTTKVDHVDLSISNQVDKQRNINIKGYFYYTGREGWKFWGPAVIGPRPVLREENGKLVLSMIDALGNPLAFAADDTIKAKFGKEISQNNVSYGPEGSTTVLAKATNIPVEELWQDSTYYDATYDQYFAVIKARIPRGSSVLYEPPADTHYFLFKYDEGLGIWKTIENIDVNKDKIVHVKSSDEQSGTLITFDPIPLGKNPTLMNGTKIRITTNYEPYGDDANSKEITLRTRGPIENDPTIQEDLFRRWIDLNVVMDKDFPAVGDITVEIYDKSGHKLKEQTFTSRKEVDEELEKLYRTDDIGKIIVKAKDKFGNESNKEVQYNEPKQIVVMLIKPMAGQTNLRVKGPKDAYATITLTYQDETITKDVTLTGKYQKIDLSRPLEPGTFIEIDAKLYQDNDKTKPVIGKTNYFREKVK